MDGFEKLWHFIGDAIIGAIGALLALQFNKEALKSWRTVFVFIGTGAVISFFCAPVIMKLFGIEPGTAAAVAFLVGALGGSILAAVIKAIENADLWEFFKSMVRSRLGISDNPGNESK
jgi:paired small multidrug resistance pump